MSYYGNNLKLTVFGESHGEAIGMTLAGIPSGHKIDMDGVLLQMARRAPGKDPTATPRLEKDFPSVKSGFLDGVTTGAPIACLIENTMLAGSPAYLARCPGLDGVKAAAAVYGRMIVKDQFSFEIVI